MSRAVFLDRDGVINRVELRDGRPHPPSSVDCLEILPGVPEAVQALCGAGFRIIVVTNQPGVATGAQQREAVEEINSYIQRTLAIKHFKVCYHVDEDGCPCRKPKPGMLVEAAREWSLDLGHSFMVGDRWRDVAAGKAAGCSTILIESGYSDRRAENPDAVVFSLLEASRIIVTDRDCCGEANA